MKKLIFSTLSYCAEYKEIWYVNVIFLKFITVLGAAIVITQPGCQET